MPSASVTPRWPRIWQAHGLQPHRVRPFKVSRDTHFAEKLTDVVGLYLNPPDKALVLCVNEKSQIQALDRTQPGLPIKKGRCGTLTHDYKRNGTTTLFAALNMLDGTIIGSCAPRHRNGEFRAFLRQLDRATPAGLALHLIVDNYGTHKHPQVQQWLAKHQVQSEAGRCRPVQLPEECPKLAVPMPRRELTGSSSHPACSRPQRESWCHSACSRASASHSGPS